MREDGGLHGWTRVDVLPPDGMQEVSGSSPLSSTGQKQNPNAKPVSPHACEGHSEGGEDKDDGRLASGNASIVTSQPDEQCFCDLQEVTSPGAAPAGAAGQAACCEVPVTAARFRRGSGSDQCSPLLRGRAPSRHPAGPCARVLRYRALFAVSAGARARGVARSGASWQRASANALTVTWLRKAPALMIKTRSDAVLALIHRVDLGDQFLAAGFLGLAGAWFSCRLLLCGLSGGSWREWCGGGLPGPMAAGGR